MKRKRFVLFLVLLLSQLASIASNVPVDGLFVTTNDGSICYKLDDTPTVLYAEEGGVKIAKLFLKDSTEPCLSVQLINGATLQMVYGTYVPSAIEEITKTVKVSNINGKKVILGGTLIIIDKNGIKYNINGTIIK